MDLSFGTETRARYFLNGGSDRGHLKWVPGRCRRKFEIADVISKS